ncbi:hypothetical protein GWI33_005609 [Rhynchophorus ferrugineus]|uniref:Uncharacterized protein n=1 Tax=Rhynchophorus ferrugineus TaxID=354439 RepID=A0A834IH29_RHYFE|nr:hypothetical protein GWI33_005609 [Rhynchophorus ferrugineus]
MLIPKRPIPSLISELSARKLFIRENLWWMTTSFSDTVVGARDEEIIGNGRGVFFSIRHGAFPSPAPCETARPHAEFAGIIIRQIGPELSLKVNDNG